MYKEGDNQGQQLKSAPTAVVLDKTKNLKTQKKNQIAVVRTTIYHDGLYGGRKKNFDSDYVEIAVDNGAFRCISPSASDFGGEIKRQTRNVDGIASVLQAVGISTVKWKV